MQYLVHIKFKEVTKLKKYLDIIHYLYDSSWARLRCLCSSMSPISSYKPLPLFKHFVYLVNCRLIEYFKYGKPLVHSY